MNDSERENRLQAILFEVDSWTPKEALRWLIRHSYRPIKQVHITRKFLRYRLYQPSPYSVKRIIYLGKGVHAVYEIFHTQYRVKNRYGEWVPYRKPPSRRSREERAYRRFLKTASNREIDKILRSLGYFV